MSKQGLSTTLLYTKSWIFEMESMLLWLLVLSSQELCCSPDSPPSGVGASSYNPCPRCPGWCADTPCRSSWCRYLQQSQGHAHDPPCFTMLQMLTDLAAVRRTGSQGGGQCWGWGWWWPWGPRPGQGWHCPPPALQCQYLQISSPGDSPPPHQVTRPPGGGTWASRWGWRQGTWWGTPPGTRRPP